MNEYENSYSLCFVRGALLVLESFIFWVINTLGAEWTQKLHVFTLNFIKDLAKSAVLPQISPTYVPNTMILKQIDGALS
jgi:hypothetical protein